MDSGRLANLLTDLDEHRRSGTDVGSLLCDECVDVLHVTGAGITLITSGDHCGSLGASDEVISIVEELQFTLGEGPCVDAFHLQQPVLEPDLAQAATGRWPAFSGPAVHAGVAAVFGFPLKSGASCLGALDVYLGAPGHLQPAQLADAEILAEVITHTVLALQSEAPPHELADELEAIVDYRAVVHQASGMVSAQLNISVRDALVRIRARSYIDSRPINDIARDIVRRRLRLG